MSGDEHIECVKEKRHHKSSSSSKDKDKGKAPATTKPSSSGGGNSVAMEMLKEPLPKIIVKTAPPTGMETMTEAIQSNSQQVASLVATMNTFMESISKKRKAPPHDGKCYVFGINHFP